VDEWLKEISPTAELRRWFNHDPKRWNEFRHRYRAELAAHRETIENLRRRASEGPITLVYAASDEIHNHAVVLKHVILREREHANDL